jgi:LPXTG-motif cell wall-anchored protein
MKKTRLAILTVLALVFVMAFPIAASAATQSDIESALSEFVTSAYGQTVTIDPTSINAASTYINTNNVVDPTLDAVLAEINAAKATIRGYNQYIENRAALEALISPQLNNVVTILNNSSYPNVTLAQVEAAAQGHITGTGGGGGSNPLAQTGADYSALAIFGGIAAIVIAAGAAIARRKRLVEAE